MKSRQETKEQLSEAILQQESDLWSCHKKHTREQWRAEVAEGNTQRGYWDWVFALIEEETE